MSYRSVEDRGPIAVITHPREAILAAVPAHVVSGPDLIRVHTRSEATVVVVRGRVDDGPWTTLEVDEEVGSWWSAPLDGDRLCKGGHTLEVEVCDEEDRRGLRSIRFVVDPTGRYTAITRVEPLVEQTAFC
jgi:3',5'-cyclic-AMP phosphodiesterase